MLAHRSSGVLLPVTALPGGYGIGSLGEKARRFVDFLSDAGQSYWQILPLVPPGGGDSPYMSPSSFAGDPFLLDLEELAREGLLTERELEEARWPDPDRVDYAWLHRTRPALLRKAWGRGKARFRTELEAFWEQESDWLPDYALFMAVREKLGGAERKDWPEEIRRRPETLEALRRGLAEEMGGHAFLQFLFFRQWTALKAYANGKGIRILGDLPIYVSPDSAEVWAEPELFQLDEEGHPTAVAGVPPDAFTDEGQHWGNPLYDWDRHRATGYTWWKRRGEHMARLYDMVRIDHFRAFHTYWSIPLGAASAKEGHWEPGPGMELVRLLEQVPGLELIAEDLGDLDADARAFIAGSGLPGMKILIYAFDPVGESAYLPHNCPPESVIYTGTHDTPTFVQWLFDEASPAERDYAFDYLRLREDEGFGWGAVCGAWASPARLAIVPMQDLLGLGADARMNAPGTMGPQNWSWRVREAAFNRDVSDRLRKITRTYRRCL
ncbi:4-alpha-glucanotransferase [Pseudoflavonifractor sp. MSJ-37]|uniref:4-alpha-glucanotransferase n=1 Tax=Pseudoflavonifractor sp. MSJ-37 TaxID=2841531 RepID=UPI001C11489F|nr:4-alpha-glucanotransferase [Pseudoflavonifractor sp. MSJ-37]MBU5434955.1 4-alpha-glucanotransferase [Pseudoflavonifractor sp. MSJ-37]